MKNQRRISEVLKVTAKYQRRISEVLKVTAKNQRRISEILKILVSAINYQYSVANF